MKAVMSKIGPILGLILFGFALWFLGNELRHYNAVEVFRQLSSISLLRILLAILLTSLSYLALTGYDTLGFYYINKPMPYRKVAKAGFIGYAFSNNIGFSILTGGSVRYRLYSAWGLSAIEITEIVAFCGITLWTGFLTIAGLSFLIAPPIIPNAVRIPFSSIRLLGLIFLLLILAYVAASFVLTKPLKIKEWELSFPSSGIALKQVLVSSVDWIVAGTVLYVLLPSGSPLSYIGFLGVFLLAQISGILSQIPGGLGVFESIIILFLTPTLPTSAVLGSLIVYRLIYYLLPLCVASILLGYQELVANKDQVGKITKKVTGWIPRVIPLVLSFTIFIGGAILLISGATPAEIPRLRWLHSFIPLPIIEISHFLGSLIGASLLILARGIQRRIDASYHITIILLIAGIAFSLLKGLDYEEATILALMLVALIPARREFYRKASLVGQKFTLGWIAAIIFVLASSLWLIHFSFHHIEYNEDLWWRFTFRGSAPRSLRATVGALGLTLIFGLMKLLKAARIKTELPVDEEMDKVKDIVEKSPHTDANLSLLRDKSLLFSDDDSAFIMYATEGRSWIALGDPIGDESQYTELVWKFRELCDQHDAWPVFYQVKDDYLSLYLDLGLTLLKLGEEARVPLNQFSMAGKDRKAMRYQQKKLQRDGYSFHIITKEEAQPLLSEFREVSDIWLKEKHTREKGFSLGFFDETYLSNFPFAIVKRDHKIVAFANLWIGADKYELSVDLMRHRPDTPSSIMDFMFIELMTWGQQEGYQWFNLGMAPLSGMENHELAPIWNRLASMIYTRGEYFYNFQGLRKYKNKFDPVWEPKYLACPGGLALPRILTNATTLISRGLKGVVSK
ncbi:MAG TPA: bifunctional lysylphosphatidylglycerol flippase/synthetase MprF [Balneolales bacterium]|nr:bifunctional lysylphosphatidylglycerol flippase/synthetase MprF [Balneolales bacterium]